MKKEIKLSDIPKRQPYQAPEGYFDRLPMRVMERTAAKEQEQTTWLPNLWRPLRLAVAPLLLLLLFVGVYFYSKSSESEKQIINLATVSDTAIMDYLSTYATLETADFAELNNLREQELPAEVLNVSATAAEEELEYYNLNDIDY
ncbi:hypothetical protein POKO110462_22145 [Pontibacter korlensis]|uniref:Uncharacterized protein n=1 Tax=Pontibacter korlensis TaxID=400092 RepID=A0A0E3ZB83_9BACT|nr:hypothetical protein [Pontibacter korlensis]AKD01843.1 hypothetical protein PKOR_00105 [Pontibacter korlensis]